MRDPGRCRDDKLGIEGRGVRNGRERVRGEGRGPTGANSCTYSFRHTSFCHERPRAQQGSRECMVRFGSLQFGQYREAAQGTHHPANRILIVSKRLQNQLVLCMQALEGTAEGLADLF